LTKLNSFFLNNRISLLVFICILAVYGLSFHKRQESHSFWLEHDSEYAVGPVTAISAMDAYYWLKMARNLDEGKLGKKLIDPTRGYPDRHEYSQTPNLLPRLISFAKNFTGGDYYRAGLLLVPILAGLFVFPLFFYFSNFRFGASAVLGGLVGSFSPVYYERSSGFVDTDLLNIFFPLAVSCFILLMNKERALRVNILLSVGAGTAMYLFNWWYQQPGFILVYLFFMAAYLLLNKIHWQRILGLLLVFLLASGPGYVLYSVASITVFFHAFFFPLSTGQIVWPDVMIQIAEAQQLDPVAALKKIHGFLPLVFAGLIGLVYLYIRRFRQMIPITPLLILGFWSLVGPQRFTMYLAPFIGIGAGVLIELMVQKAGGKIRLRPPLVPLVSISLMLILFFSTTAYTGFNRKFPPSVPASTTRAFLEIKQLVPKHSAMFTWWDYGYPLMEIGEFATYHDGSLHGGPRTTLIAKAMTSSSQEEMIAMLSYLEDKGFDSLSSLIVNENLSADDLKELVFSYPGSFSGENVHLLYTEDMISKFGTISIFGTWDFNEKNSDLMYYEEWACFSRINNIIRCKEGMADLDRGVISNGGIEVQLNGVLFVNNGHVVGSRNYRSDQKYYLQILMRNGEIFQVQVVEDRLYRSNFNQQYLLGNYDRRYFEEVYNNWPVARVLRVKRSGAAGLDQ
jgi:undecaprenyl-diphosphooligosaccharide---protein glycotransferase